MIRFHLVYSFFVSLLIVDINLFIRSWHQLKYFFVVSCQGCVLRKEAFTEKDIHFLLVVFDYSLFCSAFVCQMHFTIRPYNHESHPYLFLNRSCTIFSHCFLCTQVFPPTLDGLVFGCHYWVIKFHYNLKSLVLVIFIKKKCSLLANGWVNHIGMPLPSPLLLSTLQKFNNIHIFVCGQTI